MRPTTKAAGSPSVAAVVMLLLGWVYDLAQRVARVEARQEFFHGQPTSGEEVR